MKRTRRSTIFILFSLACLILAVTFGCAREDKYIGSYTATEKSPPEFRAMQVELQKDGKGIRRVNGEEVQFEWKVKGSELRIHTRAGGILIAKMNNGILEVELPGSKILYLQKVK
jgi:hypothetical protein